MDSKDELYHQRCLHLALKGIANVAPNPMVGAIVVHNNTIIGEGYHSFFGGPHAEVNAINSVKNHSLLEHATLYVNLEPCSHFGKTPPCADFIIEKKIKRVVIGQTDPFSEVSGRGVNKLRAAGIDVHVGLHEHDCNFINRRFLCFHQQKRPYIILKWAETADGFVDIIRQPNQTAAPTWITSELTRSLVHKWRTEEQAILIGTNTALSDNPKLNSRDWHGKSPIRLVLDKNLRLPANLNIFDKSIPTYIFTEKQRTGTKNLEYVNADFSRIHEEIFSFCLLHNIISIIVEGGTLLHTSFIERNMWDEARVFKSEVTFAKGISSPTLKHAASTIENLDNCQLFTYFNL